MMLCGYILKVIFNKNKTKKWPTISKGFLVAHVQARQCSEAAEKGKGKGINTIDR
jgi:hypothetical protein